MVILSIESLTSHTPQMETVANVLARKWSSCDEVNGQTNPIVKKEKM